MFYGNSVIDIRQQFFTSWSKYKQKQPLLPLEQHIAQVILDHPEYHAVLDDVLLHPDHTYFPELGETNPFLHMGLHLAIREHVATDRPAGIAAVYMQLLHKKANAKDVEHLMMECLAECLWTAQRHQSMPNEDHYLRACKQLLSLDESR